MIQRKQTLLLLVTTIISILMFFIPFQSYTLNEGEKFNLNLIYSINTANTTSNIYYPFTLNISISLLSLVVIFLYKNRVLQYKLGNLLVVFNVFLTGLFFLLDFLNIVPKNISFSFGSFLPIISAFLAYIAAYLIKKDEQLVRSVDRIR